jgi:hypothetical protein
LFGLREQRMSEIATVLIQQQVAANPRLNAGAHLNIAPSDVSSTWMGTEIKTWRARRSLLDKLKGWERAYETKISNGRREAVGRGRTLNASREAAQRRWDQAYLDPAPELVAP